MKFASYQFFLIRYLSYSNNTHTSQFGFYNIIVNVSFSVAFLFSCISINNGFQNDLKKKVLDNTPHIVINNFADNNIKSWSYIINRIKKNKHICEITPTVCTKGLILKDKTCTVYINGISLNKKSYFYKNISIMQGALAKLAGNSNNIAIGHSLASNLNLHVNDIISLIIFMKGTLTKEYQPTIRYFKVCAIFNMNNLFNNSQIFLSLSKLKKTLHAYQNIDVITIKLVDAMNADKIAKDLNKVLNNKFQLKTWIELNHSIFNMINVEEIILYILETLTFIFIFFNLVCAFSNIILRKKIDISILKIIGMSNHEMIILFTIKAIILNLIAITCGIVLGSMFLLNNTYLIFFMQKMNYVRISYSSFNNLLPYNIYLQDLYNILLYSSFICLLSIFYPLAKIYNIKPNKLFND